MTQILISNRINRTYRLTVNTFHDGQTVMIYILLLSLYTAVTDSSLPFSNILNNTGVWSLIKLASLYTVQSMPLSAVNGLSCLTMTRKRQARPIQQFLVSAHYFQIKLEWGPLKKYAMLFLTKFDPICHKLSHMANPPMKNMSQATIPTSTVCMLPNVSL